MTLKKQVISGTRWTTVATVNNTIVQVVKLSVLTRLLDKSDFGLVAIVLMIIGFMEIFSNLGLTVALLHKQDINAKQLSSVYWMNIIASIAIFILTWISSVFFVSFYHEPILYKLIPLMGLQILFNAFGKIFYTLKTRDLEFKFISKINILSVYVGFGVTVYLAWKGFQVYSLVLGTLAQVFLAQVIYACSGLKTSKISFHLNIREIRDMIKIGGYQVGAQTFDYFSLKLDVFLIGRFLGMENLGIYNLAKELIIRPYMVLNTIVMNVATPYLSKLQNNIRLLRDNYLKVLLLQSVVNIPVYVSFFLFASFIVKVLYGSGYEEVAVIIQILSFPTMLSALSTSGGTLQVALGRTDIGLLWTMIRSFLTPIAILISYQWGIIGVAYSQLYLGFILFVLYWYITIYKLIHLSLKKYISVIIKKLAIAVGIAALFELLLSSGQNIYFLSFLLAGYFIVYSVCIFLFDRESYFTIKKLLY